MLVRFLEVFEEFVPIQSPYCFDSCICIFVFLLPLASSSDSCTHFLNFIFPSSTSKLFATSHMLWKIIKFLVFMSLCAKWGTKDFFPREVLGLCDSCLEILWFVFF